MEAQAKRRAEPEIAGGGSSCRFRPLGRNRIIFEIRIECEYERRNEIKDDRQRNKRDAQTDRFEPAEKPDAKVEGQQRKDKFDQIGNVRK